MLSRSRNPAKPPATGATVQDVPVIAMHAKFGASETCFCKDEEIYGEREPADCIFEVISGAVRSYKVLSDGRRQICAFHLPSDIFGLENGDAYRFTAEAIVETTTRVVHRHSLEYVAATDVQVARNLLSMTAKNLLHAEAHMLLLGRKTSLERVAAFLLEMDHRLTGTEMIALPMSRRDIADYLGLTLETVSRALSYLRGRGILEFSETSQRQIVLQDRAQLKKLNS
ncbi:MAG TPA: helix-turn-helix domain-containing protein [Bradyrhizobium sp.]|nr:helix-turn-helix domain-containing protein [Bradyrhizobium sp.]